MFSTYTTTTLRSDFQPTQEYEDRRLRPLANFENAILVVLRSFTKLEPAIKEQLHVRNNQAVIGLLLPIAGAPDTGLEHAKIGVGDKRATGSDGTGPSTLPSGSETEAVAFATGTCSTSGRGAPASREGVGGVTKDGAGSVVTHKVTPA
ncbi:hypothetical protein PC129_g20848 [Phytophthora cactorum]|uniref:Uncharacterized protein n=1 Tax=Phytophthora cactorum TaxID=29920 RepID=A0A8T1H751_9STRA|nr:hypothetical protein PC113_g10809 [Phytophthora cactorum]KAG2883418.1 hypothetical protein PC114_g20600 [Phytophthora cactorum]KAG2947773.1 hypothetical protein PC117_g6551 [Phytophthora cactorum]KAG2970999.1 hypothetical protein PC119_g23502 [Phytophthora cactorum]KAG2981383.1 hypothetical protein PC120_g24808 [Phytophthora cactorum]